MSAPVDDEEKLRAQASGQHVVDNTDPGEAPAILSAPWGRHARRQAGNAFGPEDSPGRYTYVGGSVPGSGRTSGQ